ncbi:MAG: DUF5721 family protein [Lachnospiraceae bacterium]|nr:DUF5721 family protein [Lachnospiraceae bacterium]
MLGFDIENVKKVMNELLMKDTFDELLFFEGNLKSLFEFRFDGRKNELFEERLKASNSLTAEEQNNLLLMEGEELVCWGMARPKIFELIKGKCTPQSFSFVLMLNRKVKQQLADKNDFKAFASKGNNYCLNFRFEKNVLKVTTATSLESFTMDKNFDKIWDGYVNEKYSNVLTTC